MSFTARRLHRGSSKSPASSIVGSWMQVSSTVSHGRAATGTASHCNTQSHADDLVPRRDGAHHAVDRFPRVGLQAPSLCAHVQYSSGAPSASVLYVPASCVLYVPEAQGSSLCVRRARTSLGRAVRTAYPGTPGASSATSRRASSATPAAASASRCADTYAGPQQCRTHGVRVPVSCLPEAQGSSPRGPTHGTYAVRVPASGVPYVRTVGCNPM